MSESTQQPTVSIVVPCFNDGRFLPTALSSAQGQRYPKVEIVVVDDGSSDVATQELLGRLERREEGGRFPLRVVRHPENRGLPAARNSGIAVAKGSLILPLDADDKLHADCCARMVGMLEKKPGARIVSTEIQFFSGPRRRFRFIPYEFPRFLVYNMLAVSSLFRRVDWERVGGYREEMREGWEDWDFWLSLLELGGEVVKIKQPLLRYRRSLVYRNPFALRHFDRFLTTRSQELFMTLYQKHRDLYQANMEGVFGEIVRLRREGKRYRYRFYVAAAVALLAVATIFVRLTP